MAFPIIPIFSFLEPKRTFDICQSLFSAQGQLVSQLCNLLPCFPNRKASEKTESAENVFAQKDVRPSKHQEVVSPRSARIRRRSDELDYLSPPAF